MSILGSPRGAPERVYSLLYARRHSAVLPAEDCAKIINPGVWSDGEAKGADKALIDDALSVAKAFGFDHEQAVDGEAVSLIDWSDDVHDRLLAIDSSHLDAVLMRTYAWVVAESDKARDLSWFVSGTVGDLVDAMGAGLGVTADGDPAMNGTKLSAWRRWMVFLGMLTRLPISTLRELPVPARRIHREMQRGGLTAGSEIDASEFVRWLGQRMPYLDGGALFTAAATRIGHRRSPTSLSPVLSLALQDLHERGVIALRATGDRASATILNGDATLKASSFHSITVGAL